MCQGILSGCLCPLQILLIHIQQLIGICIENVYDSVTLFRQKPHSLGSILYLDQFRQHDRLSIHLAQYFCSGMNPNVSLGFMHHLRGMTGISAILQMFLQVHFYHRRIKSPERTLGHILQIRFEFFLRISQHLRNSLRHHDGRQLILLVNQIHNIAPHKVGKPLLNVL